MTPEDYKKIISDAINNEVEAYTFYQTISEKVNDANLKKLFGELAGEEKGHREYLQRVLTRGPKEMQFKAAPDYKVTDALDEPELSVDMKPLDGLLLAIKKELQAAQMYTRLARASADAEQKMVFEQLANMEKGHKARLEDIYTNMAYPEAW